MAGRHVSASLTKPLLGPGRRTNPQVKKGLLRYHTHLLSGRCKRMHEVPMCAWRQNIPDFGIFQAILSLLKYDEQLGFWVYPKSVEAANQLNQL